MGNGCQSRESISNGYDLKYFETKYGQQSMLDILKWNVRKDEILHKLPEISQKYRKIIHAYKIDSIRQLNITQSNLYNEMQTKIKDIERNDTGEVTKAESQYDMCAQDLMGRKEIQKDCSQLRKMIHQAYDQEQKNTKETIQKNFQTYVQNLEKQKKSKFSEIGELSDQNRECIRKQMRKEFKKQIKGYRQQVHQQILQGKVCDMVHLKQDYNHLHPKDEIEKIKQKAEKLIRQGQQKIIGVNIFGIKSRQTLPSTGFWGCCGRA